ncbi:MAG TPA: hypothetical protein DEH25_13470 [Chloroflexi bacterium]|nr:hypothetical protein [Chloroflexota bacterium]
MFPPEKIDEWLSEVAQRPDSAALIIRFIANRLAELANWNEKLRAENIALRSGQRVQEYEQQVSHLEYQLELLKRQFGGELPEVQLTAAPGRAVDPLNLLIYDATGRIFRLELDSAALTDGLTLGNLRGLPSKGEPPRLLVAPSSEELFCIFTSGRILPLPLAAIPKSAPECAWNQVDIPHEPAVNDALACLMPASKIALADFFIQTSRRGFMKKIRMALAPSIVENRYIGTGTKLPGDQTLEVGLGHETDQYALLSRDGYLQCLSAEMLSFAVEEALRLDSSDHLVAVFPYRAEQALLVMTQIGKAIHRDAAGLEIATDLKRRGQALYSKARREKGVQVVGGAALNGDDWGLALHLGGGITLHAASQLFESGTIPVDGEILGFTAFPGAGESNPEQ